VARVIGRLVRGLSSGYLGLRDPAFDTHSIQDAAGVIVLSKTTFR